MIMEWADTIAYPEIESDFGAIVEASEGLKTAIERKD